MSLTVVQVRQAKPKDKPYKLFDSGGLYLLVNKNGGKYWRWKYRINKQEKLLSIGVFPEISLKQARSVRDEARQQLQAGNDPSLLKKIHGHVQKDGNTFEGVAREWFERHLSGLSKSHRTRTTSYLERDVFPFIGGRDVEAINPPDIIPLIDRIHKRVVRDAHLRVLQTIGQVLRYAIATGRRTAPDPTPSLKGLFPAKEPKQHFPAITDPTEIGRLLRAMESFSGNFATKSALKLSAMVMMRPGALIRAEWSEVDFERQTWTVEVKHMKASAMVKKANRKEDAHVIPLPAQAVEIFRELYPVTGHSVYVFQSPAARQGRQMPMSAETVGKALHRMGFAGEMTAHGFRGMASTALNAMRTPEGLRMWDADAIEAQLSHKDKDTVRSAYNRGDYLEERRRMLQHWADYLDQLRDGTANVIPFQQANV